MARKVKVVFEKDILRDPGATTPVRAERTDNQLRLSGAPITNSCCRKRDNQFPEDHHRLQSRAVFSQSMENTGILEN